MLFLLLSLACSPKTITETIYVDRLIYVRDSGGGDSQAGDSEPDSEGTDSELVDSQAGDSEPDSAADSADSQAGDSGDSGPVCSTTVDPRIVGMDYTCSGNVWIFRWELAGEADRVVVDGLVNLVVNGAGAGAYSFQLTSDDGSVNPGCCGELRIIADCSYAPWVSVTTEKGGRVSECGYTGSGGGNTTCPGNRWEPGGVGCA